MRRNAYLRAVKLFTFIFAVLLQFRDCINFNSDLNIYGVEINHNVFNAAIHFISKSNRLPRSKLENGRYRHRRGLMELGQIAC